MEKLLHFLKNEINENEEKVYRFQCDCLSPEDALDISVENYGNTDGKKYIELSINNCDFGFMERLKHAWKVLTGRWGWREFCFREEDYKNLSIIFDPDKKFSDLP
jgi:hypothetical protein